MYHNIIKNFLNKYYIYLKCYLLIYKMLKKYITKTINNEFEIEFLLLEIKKDKWNKIN